VLSIHVRDFNQLGQPNFLGKLKINIAEIGDDNGARAESRWFKLKPLKESKNKDRGEILLRLQRFNSKIGPSVAHLSLSKSLYL
jgi:hypothetical protein